MPIPSDFITPVQVSSKKAAFRQIQEWIIDGTLAPGEKINDTELSKVLGLSRTPVREALQLLEAQNFVEIMPGKKTIVTQIDENEIKLILPPIAALSGVACELAVEKMDAQIIENLKEMNRKIENDICNNDFFMADQHDLEFHNVILRVTNNKYIDGTLSMMLAHVRRLIYNQKISLSLYSFEEHKNMIYAFETKDKELAVQSAILNWRRPLDDYFTQK